MSDQKYAYNALSKRFKTKASVQNFKKISILVNKIIPDVFNELKSFGIDRFSFENELTDENTHVIEILSSVDGQKTPFLRINTNIQSSNARHNFIPYTDDHKAIVKIFCHKNPNNFVGYDKHHEDIPYLRLYYDEEGMTSMFSELMVSLLDDEERLELYKKMVIHQAEQDGVEFQAPTVTFVSDTEMNVARLVLNS